MIGGGEVWILLIKLGPLRCLMSIGMEHGGECSHGRSTEAVNDMICAPCLILDVEMELLQVGGPLLMVVILQLPLCLYELQRLVISVDDCLLSQNVMFPLTTRFVQWNTFPCHRWGISRQYLRVSHYGMLLMTMLSENCTYNIVRCISLNLEWLLQIG
jgi:hypothetical protein